MPGSVPRLQNECLDRECLIFTNDYEKFFFAACDNSITHGGKHLPLQFRDMLSSLGISAAAGAFGEGLLSGAPPAPGPQNLTGLGFPLWMKQALQTAVAVAATPGPGTQ